MYDTIKNNNYKVPTQESKEDLSEQEIKLIALDKACTILSVCLQKSEDPLNSKMLDSLGTIYSKIYKLYKREFSTLTPAVPIENSIEEDRIICLIDGARVKMLKKYLQSTHGISDEEYKRMWNLPDDYPMVAPKYSAQRRELAKKSGLGLNSTRRMRKNRIAGAFSK